MSSSGGQSTQASVLAAIAAQAARDSNAYGTRSAAQETITYNADGTPNVVTETDTGAVTTYAYNGDGTPHTESRALGGATTVRTFSYDGSGNLVGIA